LFITPTIDELQQTNQKAQAIAKVQNGKAER
jgi:hypothetical protein